MKGIDLKHLSDIKGGVLNAAVERINGSIWAHGGLGVYVLSVL